LSRCYVNVKRTDFVDLPNATDSDKRQRQTTNDKTVPNAAVAAVYVCVCVCVCMLYDLQQRVVVAAAPFA